MVIHNKRNRWIIGAMVITAAVIGMSLLQLGSHSVYFFMPKEALAQASTLSTQVIRVGGMVEGKSVEWQAQDLELKFMLSDLKGSRFAVLYHGAPPDMFKENSGVVVEGRLSSDGKEFVANRLMVKHSEEYKAPGEGHSLDKALMEKSFSEYQK
jgi:cytochrome c-type biogenesis protein CcmE